MLNSVSLIGRITHDLELRQTNSGKSVMDFSIAVQNQTRDEDGNYGADFFKCTVWNGTAEFVNKNMKKGSAIAVHGSLTTNEYTNRDGVDVKEVKVNVRDVGPIEFLMPKQKTQSNSQQNNNSSAQQKSSAKKETVPANNDTPGSNDPFGGEDFDIPF